ncbi:MAG: hypothetical protein K0R44_670, partial [Thermomicrobiales bacterium]|nr:hypothetical protein [Thermomicrobiales bacterium]
LGRLEVVEPSVSLPPLEKVLAAVQGWGTAMRDGDIAAQREVLAALIERVMPRRIGRGRYEVEIVWTPLGEGLREALDPVTAASASQAA